jgi:hypothetical protein
VPKHSQDTLILTLGVRIKQLDRLCRENGRNGMLVDKLRAIAPDKLNRKAVEPFDLAQKLDPVHKKHRHLNVAVAEVLEECVLKG